MADTKIYSMASNDVVIPVYAKRDSKSKVSPNTINKAIIIKGGANVRDNVTLQNRKFVVTEVTADELKILQANSAFKRKVANGFIAVGKEPESIKADKSAQLTEKQVKAKAPKAKVETGKADE